MSVKEFSALSRSQDSLQKCVYYFIFNCIKMRVKCQNSDVLQIRHLLKLKNEYSSFLIDLIIGSVDYIDLTIIQMLKFIHIKD